MRLNRITFILRNMVRIPITVAVFMEMNDENARRSCGDSET